jgi:hypothetical protein
MVKVTELRARKAELDHLKDIEKASFRSRERYRERTYLHAVYKAYRRALFAERKARAMQMAELSGITPRKNTHPLKIMIDCSSPGTDEKIRSRWAQALRCASKRNVNANDLLEFLKEEGKGGVAGRAREFAKEHTASTEAKKARSLPNSTRKK